MSRPKKDYEFLSCRLQKDAWEKLIEVCEDSGLTKTKAVERAIERYYTEYKKTGKA